jgi:putative intracellular protease/amidase
MFDLPGNDHLAELVATVHGTGGVIGAVCHGLAGLIDVRLANMGGHYWPESG